MKPNLTRRSEQLAGVLLHFRLGHKSFDVTLAYLIGKDEESEEAQEHANNSLAL
jgi:hypothetical protein